MNDIRPTGGRHGRLQTPQSQHALRLRGRPQFRTPHCDPQGPQPPTLQPLGESSRPPSNARMTSKIMSSVRRSMSYGAPGKKHEAGMSSVGMYSTPEESLSPSSSRENFHSRPLTSPTIEQIAMGLHISRTPHLGSSKAYNTHARLLDSPSQTSSRPTHRRRDSAPATAIHLPPPPQRSALKKPKAALESTSVPSLSTPLTPSDSHTSLSTLTSTNAPSTPRSNRGNPLRPTTFASRLQSSMSRLLQPMRKSSSASIVTMSTSTSDDSRSGELTPRKMVRFSSSAQGGDEDV